MPKVWQGSGHSPRPTGPLPRGSHKFFPCHWTLNFTVIFRRHGEAQVARSRNSEKWTNVYCLLLFRHSVGSLAGRRLALALGSEIVTQLPCWLRTYVRTYSFSGIPQLREKITIERSVPLHSREGRSSTGKGQNWTGTTAPLPPWKVQDLFSGSDDKKVGNKVLNYFGRISGSEAPLISTEIPRVKGGLPEFTIKSMVKILKESKKMMVPGDPLPHFIWRFPEACAKPIMEIYSKNNYTGYWPKSWKTEYLTIIPKVPNPNNLSECQNISCTSAFSKILEGQVLQQLRGELIPDGIQCRGVQKSGVEHLLVDLWEEILSSLEGGKDAAVLLGVDYEKAFNRMEHSVCLKQLRALGALDSSIARSGHSLRSGGWKSHWTAHGLDTLPSNTAVLRRVMLRRSRTDTAGSCGRCATGGGQASRVGSFTASTVATLIEYYSAVYHSLLTKVDSEELEKLHRNAIGICYGFDPPVGQTMLTNNIESLEMRRAWRCDSFIRKAATNQRFLSKWFSARPKVPQALRNRRKIVETRAVTQRRFVSPLAFMRRRAKSWGFLPTAASLGWRRG